MTKRVLWVVLAVGIFGLTSAQTTIRVGALYNVTGNMASIDGPGFNGLRLAAEEMNAKGGVLGQMLEIVALDGKSDRTEVSNAAAHMVAVDQVVAVGGLNDSTFALSAGPILQQAHVPFVVAGATLPDLPDRIGDYTFMVPFGDNAQAYAVADYAYQTLGTRSVAILYDLSYDFTLALRNFFREHWVQLAGANAMLLEDTYRGGDKNFSSQVARLRGLPKKPDVLFVSAIPDDAGYIVQQLRAAGFGQPILSGDGFDTPRLLQVAGKAADDVYFSTHVALSSGDVKVSNFVQAYKARYGREPENTFAALGYDTLYLIADAIGRAGKADPVAMQAALASTRGFQGVTGTIAYTGGRRVPRKSVTIIRITDGRYTVAAEITP